MDAGIREARTDLSKLIDALRHGEEVFLTKPIVGSDTRFAKYKRLRVLRDQEEAHEKIAPAIP